MDITIFLLHTNDVWRVIRFILIYLVLVEREEAKLEEVLDDDSDLELKQTEFLTPTRAALPSNKCQGPYLCVDNSSHPVALAGSGH